MVFLPLIRRELQARSRSRGTYWTRSAVGLAGVLVCSQAMSSAMTGSPAVMGRIVFNGIVWAAFLVTCSIALLGADTISAERREGTLLLLFLTKVKSVDVLLAKLSSVGVTSLGALLAFLPVLMVPVLAGGVTAGDASRKALALINSLFFSLAAGLFVSATQLERARAARQVVALLAVVMVVPLLLTVVSPSGLFHFAELLSPLLALSLASEASYQASPAAYWTSLAAVHALAWTLVFAAGFRLRRSLRRDESRDKQKQRAKAKREEGRRVGLTLWQPVIGEANPVEWLVFRQYGVGAGIWGVGVLALAANGWAFLARQPGVLIPGTMVWIILWPVVGGLIGGAAVAWIASRFFVGVRQTGDLELLLTSPLGAETIITDQWNVLKRLFVWPVLAMQAPLLPRILVLLGPSHDSAMSVWQFHDLAFKLLSLANTLFGTAALCWLGLWFGLKARTQAGAIAWTVGLAQGIPCLISALGALVALSLFSSLSSTGVLGVVGSISTLVELFGAAWWMPQAMMLGFLLWLIRFARLRLLRELAGPDSVLDLRAELIQGIHVLRINGARTVN